MSTTINTCSSPHPQLELNFSVKDAKTQQSIYFHFKHTRHSFKRACQRGITTNKIAAALQFGENIYKQGLIFYILGEQNIPESLSKQKSKLINTVVVVSGDSNQIITCYRSSSPFRNIRLKSKQLVHHYGNAA